MKSVTANANPAKLKHKWDFKLRIKKNVFSWKSSSLAIARLKQALAEIRKVAKTNPVLAAEGAIELIERLSPALEHVDSSSGALGSAVNYTIAELVPIMSTAQVDAKTRDAWLERLFAAHEADGIPYIECLTDYWGELCASKDGASAWADKLLGITRMALSPDKSLRGHFHGTTACLSTLFYSERYTELFELLKHETFWPYKHWEVKTLVASGQKSEAIRCAGSCRGPYGGTAHIDFVCEEILISSGMFDEAYSRYAMRANQRGTYLATFRAVSQKYPHKSAADILGDLVKTTPGEEGKWFAAAKDAGLYDEAISLAKSTPCNPTTLTRAARDFVQKQPAFAVEAGLLAIHWLVQGYGYEVTAEDVYDAQRATIVAAEHRGNVDEAKRRMSEAIAAGGPGAKFVSKILGGNHENTKQISTAAKARSLDE